MTILIAFLIAVPIGVAIERKRAKRHRPILISRLPTQLERNPLDTPSVWRQRVARELVFGRVIEADATEVRS